MNWFWWWNRKSEAMLQRLLSFRDMMWWTWIFHLWIQQIDELSLSLIQIDKNYLAESIGRSNNASLEIFVWFFFVIEMFVKLTWPREPGNNALQQPQSYHPLEAQITQNWCYKTQQACNHVGKAENVLRAIFGGENATGQLSGPMQPVKRSENVSLLKWIPFEAVTFVINLRVRTSHD